MRISLLFCIIFFNGWFAVPAFAVTVKGKSPPTPAAELKEALRKIDQVRKTLKLSASSQSSKTCEIPDMPDCSFESLCSSFANKAQNFYLYQDQAGHKIQNFSMIIYERFAEACLGKTFPQAAVQDPFAYPEQLIDEKQAGGAAQLEKNRQLYDNETVRARTVFTDAQRQIIEVLEKRRTDENTQEITAMIERVKAVNLRMLDVRAAGTNIASFGCEAPNAFFKREHNEVILCPQFMNMPAPTLFRTLAHELGHSIDPCEITSSYKAGEREQAGRLFMVPPKFMGGEVSEAVKLSGISLEKNPMGEVISCLQSPGSTGIKIPSQEDLLAAVDAEEQDLRKQAKFVADADPFGIAGDGSLDGSTVDRLNSRRELIKTYYDDYKACGYFTGNGQFQEVFADWVASQALQKKLSKIPSQSESRQYAFESQGVLWGAECENIKQSTAQKISRAAGSRCPSFEEYRKKLRVGSEEDPISKQKYNQEKKDHPPTTTRMNRIFLSMPEMQQALGCKTGANGIECK